MFERKRIELDNPNSILEFIIDESGKILYVKKQISEGKILKIKGYGKLVPNKDIKFSNLRIPSHREKYKVRFQYDYDEENKTKVGYITILDSNGNVYSQESLLDYSSMITIEEGHEIIKDTVPVLGNNINDNLSKMVGTDIKSVNKFIKHKKKVRKL